MSIFIGYWQLYCKIRRLKTCSRCGKVIKDYKKNQNKLCNNCYLDEIIRLLTIIVYN